MSNTAKDDVYSNLDAPLLPKEPQRAIRVKAPMTLDEGYTFVSTLPDGKAFQVVVPEGGVTEGESFDVPYPMGSEFLSSTVIPPRGQWKDGLCDCFKPGLCHPSLCCALFCTALANAQVMTRMRLTWLGKPGNERGTFKTILFLVIATTIILGTLEGVGLALDLNVMVVISDILEILFGLFIVYLLMVTRRTVRWKYGIPQKNCDGCEDCCCACFCGCCTVSQMMRHTGDYESYQGKCCSATGLPDDAPTV